MIALASTWNAKAVIRFRSRSAACVDCCGISVLRAGFPIISPEIDSIREHLSGDSRKNGYRFPFLVYNNRID